MKPFADGFMSFDDILVGAVIGDVLLDVAKMVISIIVAVWILFKLEGIL